MYKIDFYRDKNGRSEISEFMNYLAEAYPTSKDARIQHDKITAYINLLIEYGVALPERYTKHIDEDIWELRPGKNRVLFFCWTGTTFVMLHHFRKTTNKTLKQEINKAKRERDDYIRRHK